MSNTVVGPTYKKILDAVIEASRTDFEENGVNNAVLEHMKEDWQNRLTDSHRALFPWDEQPEPPPSQRSLDQSPIGAHPPGSSQTNGYNSPQIKQEPYDQSYLNLPARGQPGPGPDYASQRAAQLMQGRFGHQANNSIGALQAAQVNRGYGGQNQLQHPGYSQQSPYATPPQHQQQQPPQQNVQAQPQQQQPQVKNEPAPPIKQENDQRNGLGSAQLDGPSDDSSGSDAVIATRNARGETHPFARLEADTTIRSIIEANAQRLEGGGLMLPLSERRSTLPSSASRIASTPRLGGDAADDEDDEDAINSDLDDPDDTGETNLEGAYDGDVVLCLYDKVQRVKNKWKCVLREGILTIEGKDYLFHKATGEFEW